MSQVPSLFACSPGVLSLGAVGTENSLVNGEQACLDEKCAPTGPVCCQLSNRDSPFSVREGLTGLPRLRIVNTTSFMSAAASVSINDGFNNYIPLSMAGTSPVLGPSGLEIVEFGTPQGCIFPPFSKLYEGEVDNQGEPNILGSFGNWQILLDGVDLGNGVLRLRVICFSQARIQQFIVTDSLTVSIVVRSFIQTNIAFVLDTFAENPAFQIVHASTVLSGDASFRDFPPGHTNSFINQLIVYQDISEAPPGNEINITQSDGACGHTFEIRSTHNASLVGVPTGAPPNDYLAPAANWNHIANFKFSFHPQDWTCCNTLGNEQGFLGRDCSVCGGQGEGGGLLI